MKPIFRTFIIAILLMGGSDALNATDNQTLHVSLDIKHDTPPNRDRKPSRRIPCVIDLVHGVSIENVEPSSILSYELWDEEGANMASFTEEADFLTFLATHAGCFFIRFITTDYVYIGFIELQ